MKPRLTRAQKATIFSGVNLIVTLLVVLQLWLLTATMNAWLGGDVSVVWPALLASLGCLIALLICQSQVIVQGSILWRFGFLVQLNGFLEQADRRGIGSLLIQNPS